MIFAFAKAKGESFPFAFALVSPRQNISTTLDTLRLHYRRNHFPDLFLLVVNILEHLFSSYKEMRRRVSSRLQEYPFLSKISFCSHAAEAILFVDLKKTAKHDVIIPDYSKYSALWSRMCGIHSTYSGIGIASQSNGCSGLFLLFLFRNSVNRTHPKSHIL